jgi:hypothetical protein
MLCQSEFLTKWKKSNWNVYYIYIYIYNLALYIQPIVYPMPFAQFVYNNCIRLINNYLLMNFLDLFFINSKT